MSRSWSTVWINMQKMSNGDYFDEKMRRGDRSKEARRISPPLKLLLKSPKLRGSTAPKSAHLHRGREQGERLIALLELLHLRPSLSRYPLEKKRPILGWNRPCFLVFSESGPWRHIVLTLFGLSNPIDPATMVLLPFLQ